MRVKQVELSQFNILRLEIELLTFLDLELDGCRPFSSIYQQFFTELILIIVTTLVLIWMLNRYRRFYNLSINSN